MVVHVVESREFLRLAAVRVFSSMPGSANECAELTAGHMKWMIEFLEECGGKCTYQQIVDVGEEHHCDTVGALLKVLKNRCAIVISRRSPPPPLLPSLLPFFLSSGKRSNSTHQWAS